LSNSIDAHYSAHSWGRQREKNGTLMDADWALISADKKKRFLSAKISVKFA
jgi:alkyl hydroperoxide reductase subunit AhpC